MDNRAEIAARQLDQMVPPVASSDGVTVGELLAPHPDYDADLIEQYQTWYDGGSRFREALSADRDGTYLSLRRADKDKLDDTYTYRKLRMSRAQYSSEIGRIIASMQATILRLPPVLVDTDEYIQSLNADADGAGTDLKDLARQILECGLLHRRAYLAPTFPGIQTAAFDMEQAMDAGALDGRLRFYHARNVPWWSYAPDGRLQSVRIYTYQDIYSRGTWGKLLSREHRWTIIDDVSVIVYGYTQSASANGRLLPVDKTKPARLVSEDAHGYVACPVREYQFGKSFWVADRLVDPQKRLFNSEADEAFIRSECAHPQRVIIGTPMATMDENGNEVVKGGPVYAVKFGEGAGDYKIVGPDAAQSQWHSTAIERDRANLYASLEALFLGNASQGQNARQAASAKAMDASHSTLFMAFAAALLEELLLTVVGDIKDKRGSVTPVFLEGLNRIDGRTIEQAVSEAKAFMALSPPLAAARHVVGSVCMRIMAGASEEDQQAALSELKTMTFSAPARVGAAPNPGMPKPDAGDEDVGEDTEE